MAKKNSETVTISMEEYDELLRESRWLSCLEAAGVDNWEGYGIAIDMRDDDSEDCDDSEEDDE